MGLATDSNRIKLFAGLEQSNRLKVKAAGDARFIPNRSHPTGRLVDLRLINSDVENFGNDYLIVRIGLSLMWHIIVSVFYGSWSDRS